MARSSPDRRPPGRVSAGAARAGRRTTATVAGFVAVAAAAMAAWFWLGGDQGVGSVGIRPLDRRPSAAAARVDTPVVIYLIDTLRADRLGVYGYAKPTSPRIDGLAKESVLFEHAYSAAPWTLPSVASLVTSTYACEHGIIHRALGLDPGIKTLAEQLRAAGYRTGAYYHNAFAGPMARLDRGYDISEMRHEAPSLAPDVGTFVEGTGSTPFYLYLHTIEPHQTFNVPFAYLQKFGFVEVDDREAFRKDWELYSSSRHADVQAGRPRGSGDTTRYIERAAAGLTSRRAQIGLLYDAAVRQADDHLGEAIDVLKQRGVWDQALFILLADHGEEFGEHGGWFHDQSVYEELIHVPLLIHLPKGARGGTRVRASVSLLDIMPTVLAAVGRPELCAGCRGVSLLGLLRGDPPATRPALEVAALRMNETTYNRDFKRRRGDLNVVVRQDQWKGIWNVEPKHLELYDLAADPGETTDVSGREPARSADLAQRADGWLATCRAARKAPLALQPEEVDERTRNQLRGLGYLE